MIFAIFHLSGNKHLFSDICNKCRITCGIAIKGSFKILLDRFRRLEDLLTFISLHAFYYKMVFTMFTFMICTGLVILHKASEIADAGRTDRATL